MSHSSQPMSSLLECPICLGSFTDPRTLACLHTLCHQCLDDHMVHSGEDGQFKCPVCRRISGIPTDGADSFPKNFFINSYVAAVGLNNTGTGARSKTRPRPKHAPGAEKHLPDNNICSNSDDGDDCSVPEKFCIVCCEYYCKACSKAHSKSKASRSHELVDVRGLTDVMLMNAMSNSQVPRCVKHKEEKLKLYCQTCQCAVCSVCCLINHKPHVLQEISEVDDDIKLELKRSITNLQDLIREVKQHTTQVDKQRFESNISLAGTITRTIFQTMHEMIGQKAKQVDQKICKLDKERAAQNDAQNKANTLQIQLLESLESFARDLLDRGSVYNRLACLPEIRHRLQEFDTSPSDYSDFPTGDMPPGGTELVIQHLDGMLLQQDVNLGGPTSRTEPTLEIQIKCSLKQNQSRQQRRDRNSVQMIPVASTKPTPQSLTPRLTVVVCLSTWLINLVDNAANSLQGELRCEVRYTDSRQLQPVVRDQLQIDIIHCGGDEITNVGEEFHLDKKTAGNRCLVLLHVSRDGTLAKTCSTLGTKANFFRRVIHWDGRDGSRSAVTDSLADYFSRYSRQSTRS